MGIFSKYIIFKLKIQYNMIKYLNLILKNYRLEKKSIKNYYSF